MSRSSSSIPGPRTPDWLQTYRWLRDPGREMRRNTRRYGHLFEMGISRETPWVMAADLDDIHAIFNMGIGDYRTGVEVVRPTLGRNSLLVLSGEDHLSHRRMITPAFHGERLAAYAEIMREETMKAVATMPLGEFSLRDYSQPITLDVIMRAVFGREEPALREQIVKVTEWFEGTKVVAMQAVFGYKTKFVKQHRERVLSLVRSELDAVIRDRLRSTEDDGSILAMLLAARDADGNGLSPDELRDEVITLIIAGHETSATALAWTVEELIRDPQKLERASQDREYRQAAIKESLRLRTIIPDVPRRLLKPLYLPGTGYTVPADYKLSANIHVVHHRADIYEDPEAFRPERFLPGAPKLPQHAWIPFGRWRSALRRGLLRADGGRRGA
jgi:cytochrome P450 family 135